MKQTLPYQKNQRLVGEVHDLTHEGQGVVKIDGYPFFVEGTIPGEIVEIQVTKVGKSFGYARLMDIQQPSSERVQLTDAIGRQIGTMTLQHIAYPAQLMYKQQQVQQAFRRLGKFEDITIQPTIGMEHPWQYRNKAQIPVREYQGVLTTGFFRKNSHQLIPVENFHIQHPEIDQAVLTIRDIMRQYQVTPYHEESHSGLLRHIIVKRGHYSGEMMVILVINGKKLPQLETIIKDIHTALPQVVSIVLNYHTQRSNVILGKDDQVVWGQPYYRDTMLGLDFQISAHSFYQVNTPQSERLYQLAIDAAAITDQDCVLDAYCGIGTISLALAKHAKQVYAMEIVPQAIEMAKMNAALNGVGNVVFEVGAAETVLPKWSQEGIHFDVAVVDPPRKGLDRSFIETLIEQQPQRIVYVSCNPATCARDCRLLADAGYELQWVQPVDLFAQTSHVECVVLMNRKER